MSTGPKRTFTVLAWIVFGISALSWFFSAPIADRVSWLAWLKHEWAWVLSLLLWYTLLLVGLRSIYDRAIAATRCGFQTVAARLSDSAAKEQSYYDKLERFATSAGSPGSDAIRMLVRCHLNDEIVSKLPLDASRFPLTLAPGGDVALVQTQEEYAATLQGLLRLKWASLRWTTFVPFEVLNKGLSLNATVPADTYAWNLRTRRYVSYLEHSFSANDKYFAAVDAWRECEAENKRQLIFLSRREDHPLSWRKYELDPYRVDLAKYLVARCGLMNGAVFAKATEAQFATDDLFDRATQHDTTESDFHWAFLENVENDRELLPLLREVHHLDFVIFGEPSLALVRVDPANFLQTNGGLRGITFLVYTRDNLARYRDLFDKIFSSNHAKDSYVELRDRPNTKARSIFDSTRAAFAAGAGTYLKDDSHWGDDSDIVFTVGRKLKTERGHDVDVLYEGVGPGRILASIISQERYWQMILATDYAQDMLRCAGQELRKLDSLGVDVTNVNLKENDIVAANTAAKDTFDIVLCFNNTLGNILLPNGNDGLKQAAVLGRERALQRFKCALRPGGKLILTVYDFDQLALHSEHYTGNLRVRSRIGAQDLLLEYGDGYGTQILYSHWFTEKEVRELLETAGFRIESLERRRTRLAVIAQVQ